MFFYKTNIKTCPEIESEVALSLGDIVYISSWNNRCFQVFELTEDSVYLVLASDIALRRQLLTYPTDVRYYI